MTTKWIARLHTDQRGLTLTEVVVAMMVMSLAAGVFLSTLASVQKSVAETDIHENRMGASGSIALAVALALGEHRTCLARGGPVA